ncbi:Zn-ribbon domain-containing OB-fold protein [Caldimonas tepidiphila]|uniref:Zn-ribbon domain-containing OB-fold protein n=1 Tax=Caldimonas tepidiphila TaxID=2315841 RepID=UPI000E5B6E44|nr:Zn-ribbon domain-containing OB-fold protein [Caldimonas tepidiphila]
MRKIPAPHVLPESKPFWDAADQGRLLLKRCAACGQVHHYPRDICPFCLSEDTHWVESAGTGTLYSFSTMGQGDTAHTLAMVTLDEGVTLLTNLVDCDPARARIGDRVQVRFQPSQGGPAVPMFTLNEGGAA